MFFIIIVFSRTMLLTLNDIEVEKKRSKLKEKVI